MHRIAVLVLLILGLVLSQGLAADDLTRTIQKDLIALGYDPGNIQGEASTQTVIAISKFQAEHGMEVTGEPTPQLAGVIKAEMKKRSQPAQAPAATAPAVAAAPATAPAPGGMTAAQALCIQKKMEEREAANKKKRGIGRLMNAVSRTASRFGGSDVAQDISRTTGDVYNANATAEDIRMAARDLGVTEDEIEQCQNAQ